ncbi:PLD nuclease N-terminal domain-containing protein [Microbacterium sp.]|jgi:hypothetical protein|uniref:PLD nuclease N-terminal domain-containing protein n=1 Tax=Microbacterium sp. TaxID=51671 RepID=UPI0037C688ED
MPRVLLIVAVLALAFYVVSIVDVAVQPPTRHRGVSKATWIAIVILLPVLGGALWFVVGRSRPSRLKLALAPDDDPEFLGRVGGGSFSDQDERIRRLEEELAMLDSEADDPRNAAPAPVDPESADPGAIDPDSDGPRRGSIG